MVNKEELKKTLWNGFKSWEIVGGVETEMVYVPKQALFDLIDQLDEPKIISQTQAVEFLAGEYNLTEDEVDKVLLNYRKPVVPSFVAEIIETYKRNDSSLGELLTSVEYDTRSFYYGLEKYRSDVTNLYLNSDNICDIIARAWINGYTVEEKKYLVLDKKGCVLLKKYISGVSLITTTGIKLERFPEWQQGDLMLTEQEIKDYDERFWPFAVPVEEEEE